MRASFERFFDNEVYLQLKNNLFNYVLRRRLILVHSPSARRILDIGSGMSPVSPEWDKTVFVDFSEKALLYLTNTNKLTAVNADICHMPFKHNSFDLVVCSEVMEHVPDDTSAIRELCRLTSTHGTMLVTVPLHKSYRRFDDAFAGHKRRYDPEKFKSKLEQSGFTVKQRVKAGGPLERVSTLLVTYIFTLISDKEKSYKIPAFVFFPYRLINLFYSYILHLDALIWPTRFTSIMLFICKKQNRHQ